MEDFLLDPAFEIDDETLAELMELFELDAFEHELSEFVESNPYHYCPTCAA